MEEVNQADVDYYKSITRGCSEIAAKRFAQRVNKLLKGIDKPSHQQVISARQKALMGWRIV